MAAVAQQFEKIYGFKPQVTVNSPGRINLLGEHVDYNDGFVLPASINKSIVIAMAEQTNGDVCRLFALDFNQEYSFSLHDLQKSPLGWPDYIQGVVEQIQKAGYTLKPFVCAFGGNIPSGAGLSSSAALECGIAFALNEVFNLGLSRVQMVLFSKQAENQFVGVNCGVMDQFASSFGKENSIIKLDCKTLDYEYVPFVAPEYDIVLCDTAVKHSLGSSAYNTRRQECEHAIAVIKAAYPQVQTYRDATLAQLNAVAHQLPADTIKRATYAIEEIERVALACDYLTNNQIEAFGELMFKTHDGLSELFEVSCPELDFLKAEAVKSGLSAGSRMMGGGFGGCTINLVKKENTQQFIQILGEAYKAAYDIDLKTYVVQITDGTTLL